MTELGNSTYLWILIYFWCVFFIAVNIQSHSCSSTSCATKSENDARAISKDEPQTLNRKKERKKISIKNFH